MLGRLIVSDKRLRQPEAVEGLLVKVWKLEGGVDKADGATLKGLVADWRYDQVRLLAVATAT